MRLRGDKVFLTMLQEDEIELIREWRNQYKNNFFDSSEISKEAQRIFYDKYEASHTDCMFIIHSPNGTKIGTIALYNIDLPTRTAKIGRVLLLKEYRGQGYAEDAVKIIVKYAFEIVRLFKLTVEVYLENLDAIAIYARAGFSHTKPIIILNATNNKINWKEPVRIESYDDLSETGYEGQEANIK